MRNATLFHGTGGTPEMFWFPYLKGALASRGYDVRAPQLPRADAPTLDEWLPVAQSLSYDENSVLIGHSAGCPLILALLETLDSPVRQTILVAGFCSPIAEALRPMVREQYRWDRIGENAGEVFIVCSDDDPWGCDDEEGRKIFESLGGNLLIRHGEGHMGSESFDQPYREFPLLTRLIA